MYIVWSKENELGIPIIDEQHRGLISTINTLYHFIRARQGVEILNSTLAVVRHYSEIHFQTEIALIRDAGYAGVEEHMALHSGFLGRSREVAEEAIEHGEPEILLKFLKEWWLMHIGHEDRKYAPRVRAFLGIE